VVDFESKFVTVQGIRTHYIESGSGSPLILLHSGEFGACGALTWEYNIPHLAEHFRVIAPDWLGFGKTEKLFSFEDMRAKRVWHMRAFLDKLGIEDADFMGNSMGGTMLLEEVAQVAPAWRIHRAIAVSGGGYIPDNHARRLLGSYDGTLDYMRRIVETLFLRADLRTDAAYIARRHEISRDIGSWECTSAARFRAPWRDPAGSLNRQINYSNIKVPVLLVAGRQDNLRLPDYAENLHREIPGARLAVIEEAGHCPQIDRPEEFNRVVLEFLVESAFDRNEIVR
jgi:pimeloyl-ACP methyl ester carboxylesterase